MKFLSCILLFLLFASHCQSQNVLDGIYKQCFICDSMEHMLEGDWVNINDSQSYIKFHHKNTELRLYKESLKLYDAVHYSGWIIDSISYNDYLLRLFYESAHSPWWEETKMPINLLNKDTLKIGQNWTLIFIRKRN